MDAVFRSSDEEMEDYYAVLGCTELSSQEQIDAEYKLKAKECHPDRIIDQEMKSKAEVTFMKLNKAHSTLKDPKNKSSVR